LGDKCSNLQLFEWLLVASYFFLLLVTGC